MNRRYGTRSLPRIRAWRRRHGASFGRGGAGRRSRSVNRRCASEPCSTSQPRLPEDVSGQGEAVFERFDGRCPVSPRGTPSGRVHRLGSRPLRELDPTAEVLVTWDLPTADLAEVAPNLRLIHIIGAGVEHLCPLDWVPEGSRSSTTAALTRQGGRVRTHGGADGAPPSSPAARTGNRCTRPRLRERRCIGVGSIVLTARTLGMRVLGVTRHGRALDAVDEMHTTDRLDDLLPRADFVFVAVRSPRRPATCSMRAGRD